MSARYRIQKIYYVELKFLQLRVTDKKLKGLVTY